MSKKLEVPKSDAILAAEVKEILNEYVIKARELLARGMVVGFSIANGGDGNDISLANFSVQKRIYLPGESIPTPGNDA